MDGCRATGTKFQAPCPVLLRPWGEILGRLFLSRPAVPALALLPGAYKVPVGTAFLHEQVVGAPLGDAAILDDQDLVCVPDGVEPVGDDQQGLAPAQFTDGLLDVLFIVRVHAGCGLVQDDDRGVL